MLRLSQAECLALYKQSYISHYKMLLQGTTVTDYWGRTTTIIGYVTKAWLLTQQGREGLKEHDLTSKIKRTYHDFDAGFDDWQDYQVGDEGDEYDEGSLNEYDGEGWGDDSDDD